VKSLIVMPVVATLVMNVLANNLITAFGMMAVFTIVRFRNMLRDTLDTVYILMVLVLGMAAGSQKFTSAAVGVVIMAGSMLYLSFCNFGTRQRYDLILNLRWKRPLGEVLELEQVLVRHSRNCHCANRRSTQGGAGTDIAYWVLMRDTNRVEEMLTELRSVTGVTDVTSIQAEDESEV
jgi:tRNA-dihydrouridine synthase